MIYSTVLFSNDMKRGILGEYSQESLTSRSYRSEGPVPEVKQIAMVNWMAGRDWPKFDFSTTFSKLTKAMIFLKKKLCYVFRKNLRIFGNTPPPIWVEDLWLAWMPTEWLYCLFLREKYNKRIFLKKLISDRTKHCCGPVITWQNPWKLLTEIFYSLHPAPQSIRSFCWLKARGGNGTARDSGRQDYPPPHMDPPFKELWGVVGSYI